MRSCSPGRIARPWLPDRRPVSEQSKAREDEGAAAVDPIRLEATVIGRVQGVGFRYFALQEGMDLGLDGWVANSADGSVRCVAEGPRDRLEILLERLRTGPAAAIVRIPADRTPSRTTGKAAADAWLRSAAGCWGSLVQANAMNASTIGTITQNEPRHHPISASAPPTTGPHSCETIHTP